MGLFVDPKQPESTAQTALYFGPDSMVKTWQLKLVEGRDFTPEDVLVVDPDKSQEMGKVGLVTQVLAKKLFPDSSAIGKTVYIGNGPDAIHFQIIGVVEKLQSPWAQNGERGELSTILANRYVNTYLQFAVRSEPGQRDRVMKDAEAAITKIPGVMIIRTESMYWTS